MAVPGIVEADVRRALKRVDRAYAAIEASFSHGATQRAYRARAQQAFQGVVATARARAPKKTGKLAAKINVRTGRERGRRNDTGLTIRIGYFNLNRGKRNFRSIHAALAAEWPTRLSPDSGAITRSVNEALRRRSITWRS